MTIVLLGSLVSSTALSLFVLPLSTAVSARKKHHGRNFCGKCLLQRRTRYRSMNFS
jgi:hypothetical protein